MHPTSGENNGPGAENVAREALKFVLSPEGGFFRDFLMTEIVQSIDALSRKQVASHASVIESCHTLLALESGSFIYCLRSL